MTQRDETDSRGWARNHECPQCGLKTSCVIDQQESCAYCAENGRRLAAGQQVLPAPTVDFPAGQPSSWAGQDLPDHLEP